MSFVRPVPAFQEDIPHRLRPAAILAFVGIGLIDSVEVRPDVLGEHYLTRPYAEPVELSTVLYRYLGGGRLATYRLTDSKFRSRYKYSRRLRV